MMAVVTHVCGGAFAHMYVTTIGNKHKLSVLATGGVPHDQTELTSSLFHVALRTHAICEVRS